MTFTQCIVHLADNEWSRMPDGTAHGTKDMMRIAAREAFVAYPNVANMIVIVYEHAGWSLAFTRDLQVIGSANERAIFPCQVQSIQEAMMSPSATWEYLPEIRRQRAERIPFRLEQSA